MVKRLLANALARMLETGEFDKVRNYYYKQGDTEIATEVSEIKADLLDAIKAFGSMQEVPIIPLVQRITVAEVWKDIVVFMISEEHRENISDDTGN